MKNKLAWHLGLPLHHPPATTTSAPCQCPPWSMSSITIGADVVLPGSVVFSSSEGSVMTTQLDLVCVQFGTPYIGASVPALAYSPYLAGAGAGGLVSPLLAGEHQQALLQQQQHAAQPQQQQQQQQLQQQSKQRNDRIEVGAVIRQRQFCHPVDLRQRLLFAMALSAIFYRVTEGSSTYK